MARVSFEKSVFVWYNTQQNAWIFEFFILRASCFNGLSRQKQKQRRRARNGTAVTLSSAWRQNASLLHFQFFRHASDCEFLPNVTKKPVMRWAVQMVQFLIHGKFILNDVLETGHSFGQSDCHVQWIHISSENFLVVKMLQSAHYEIMKNKIV